MLTDDDMGDSAFHRLHNLSLPVFPVFLLIFTLGRRSCILKEYPFFYDIPELPVIWTASNERDEAA